MRTWDEVFQKVPVLKCESRQEIAPQVAKLQEEIEELWRAIKNEPNERVVEELGDVVHCALVLLRVLGPDGAWAFLEPVVKKNRQRGYYT